MQGGGRQENAGRNPSRESRERIDSARGSNGSNEQAEQNRSLSRNRGDTRGLTNQAASRAQQNPTENTIRVEDNTNRDAQPGDKNDSAKQKKSIGILNRIDFDQKIIKLYAANGCEHIICIDENGKAYSFGFNQRG